MKLPPIGKFIDQPLLVNSLHKYMPVLLTGTALAFGIHDTMKEPPEKRKEKGIKNAIVLSSIVLASIAGVKLSDKVLFKKHAPDSLNTILKNGKEAVGDFVHQNKIEDSKLLGILDKVKNAKNAKTGILSLGDTGYVLEKTRDLKGAQKLSETLFGKVKDEGWKGILGEIGKLSFMGFTPVAAGIGGGIAADKVTGTSTEKSTGNKVKEGLYQFLANIFMCNVGAAAALFGAEALQNKGVIKKLTPSGKMGVILAGIITTGVIGGSRIANFISKKVLDPIFEKGERNKEHFNHQSAENSKGSKNVRHFHSHHHDRHERKPEALDMLLHVDDIATAGVLSGFKWLEPVLPVMYMISGYRAGFGYRNNVEKKHSHTHMHTKPYMQIHSHIHSHCYPVLEEKLGRAAKEYKQQTGFR